MDINSLLIEDPRVSEVTDHLNSILNAAEDDFWEKTTAAAALRSHTALRGAEPAQERISAIRNHLRRWERTLERATTPKEAINSLFMTTNSCNFSTEEQKTVTDELFFWLRSRTL